MVKTIWLYSYDGDNNDGDNNDGNNNDGNNNAKSKHMGFEVMPWAFQNCLKCSFTAPSRQRCACSGVL